MHGMWCFFSVLVFQHDALLLLTVDSFVLSLGDADCLFVVPFSVTPPCVPSFCFDDWNALREWIDQTKNLRASAISILQPRLWFVMLYETEYLDYQPSYSSVDRLLPNLAYHRKCVCCFCIFFSFSMPSKSSIPFSSLCHHSRFQNTLVLLQRSMLA